MDIKTKVTYYPLKLLDGFFHIFKRTEIISPVMETKDTGIPPYDNFREADEFAQELNDNLSNIQDA